jgi:pyruvate formate lyase activating enzyme
MYPSAAVIASDQADLSVQGLLLDVDRFASHDGPGIRTTVFLKGCPLACSWCHSPESRLSHPELLYQVDRCTGCWLCLDACPHRALSAAGQGDKPVAALDRSLCDACGRCVDVCYAGALKLAGTVVSVGDLVAQVRKDIPFFRRSGGGVTLSGGEPARQAQFAYHFLKACQASGIHTALETTGYATWGVMSRLADVADLFLYDIKFVDAELHRRYTGVPNLLILDNLRRLAALDKEIHVRVPCITGINDSPAQIAAIARFVAEIELSHIVLLPYNGAAGAKYEWLDRDYALRGTVPQPDAHLHALADVCRGAGLHVQIGG